MPKKPAATTGATAASAGTTARAPEVVVSDDVPEPTSYRGRNVIELPLPAETWIRFLGVTYTIERDLTQQVGQFSYTVTAPQDVPRMFRCDLHKPSGEAVWTQRTQTGTTILSKLGSDSLAGSTTLVVRLNYENSGLADIVLPLDFGEDLRTALSQRKLSFTWAYRPVVSTTQRAEMLRQPAQIPIYLHGYQAPNGGTETLATRVPPHALTPARITTAYEAAKRTGHFDPAVFPNVGAGNDEAGRAGVIAALATLDAATVVAQLQAGDRLSVHRATNGQYTYRFIPAPTRHDPKLLLVEYYRLSSYPTRYGVGRTIKTFSLLPGEKTTIRVSSYKNSSESLQRSSSIMDSTSDESETEFERTVMSEQSNQDTASNSFEYHAEAEAEGKASWGWGSVSAKISGGVAGSSNASREEFAKNVSNAASHNAARASSRRDVQIDTSMDAKLETGEEEAVERTLENINVSRTLNFVFRQMNQEFASILHLVDVRVAFFNGHGESRDEVPLADLDRLLSSCVAPDRIGAVRDLILRELRTVKDDSGQEVADFVQQVKLHAGEDGDETYQRINPDLTSEFIAGADGPPIRVPGIILAADLHVLRTDGVVVDTFLGQGNGLDTYSTGLQEQAVRAREVDNRTAELEAAKLELATRIVADNDAERAALFQKLFVRPQIVNQIEQAAVNGNAPVDGQMDGVIVLGPSQ